MSALQRLKRPVKILRQLWWFLHIQRFNFLAGIAIAVISAVGLLILNGAQPDAVHEDPFPSALIFSCGIVFGIAWTLGAVIMLVLHVSDECRALRAAMRTLTGGDCTKVIPVRTLARRLADNAHLEYTGHAFAHTLICAQAAGFVKVLDEGPEAMGVVLRNDGNEQASASE